MTRIALACVPPLNQDPTTATAKIPSQITHLSTHPTPSTSSISTHKISQQQPLMIVAFEMPAVDLGALCQAGGRSGTNIYKQTHTECELIGPEV